MTFLTDAEIARVENDIIQRPASSWTAEEDELVVNRILGTEEILRKIEYRLRNPKEMKVRGNTVYPRPVPEDMVEDIVHEWIVDHILVRRRFDERTKLTFWPWVFLSIASFAMSRLRRKDEQNTSLDADSPPYEPVDASIDFCNEIEESETLGIVMKIIEQSSQIDETDQTILLLYYSYEMSHAEIARQLSLTSVAVRQRKARAVKHLKLRLRQRGVSITRFQE